MSKGISMPALVILVGSLCTGFLLDAFGIPDMLLGAIYDRMDFLAAQVPAGPLADTSALGIITMKACISFLMAFSGWVSAFGIVQYISKRF